MYNNLFNPFVRDSGAIMVGAGIPNTRAPDCRSNYGARVSVQAWGSQIETTGYGDIKVKGDDYNQWYTAEFGGTSGASAIVAGVVANMNGSRLAGVAQPLYPIEMRELLSFTGTAQPTPVTKNVGPLPNLRAAMQEPPSTGDVASIMTAGGLLQVFAFGNDGAPYVRSLQTSGWQVLAVNAPNTARPGTGVAAAIQGTSQTDFFFVGNDGAVWQYYAPSTIPDGFQMAKLTTNNFAPRTRLLLLRRPAALLHTQATFGRLLLT